MLLNKLRTKAIMQKQGLDLLLASTLQNVYYLSGFWNENFLITPRLVQTYVFVLREDLSTPSVVAGIGDANAVLTACPPQTQATYFGGFFRYTAPGARLEGIDQRLAERITDAEIKPNSLEALVSAFGRRGLTRGVAGYDERGMSAQLLAGLQARLPQLEFKPADATFLHIRAVKTVEEVEHLRAAVALTEDAVKASMAIARPGVREHEMIREFDKTIVAGGGRPYFTQIYFGSRGAVGQQPFTNGILRRGDIIRFDVGCVLRGYCSDIARNFAVGDPGERLRRLHAVTVTAEDAALQALRPGAKASEVFSAGVQAARAAGIPEYQRHHVGHAVGMEVYEAPILSASDHTIIEESMTFEVETPYYEVGSAGLQPEDTVVVTEGEPHMLTTLPRDLVVIE